MLASLPSGADVSWMNAGNFIVAVLPASGRSRGDSPPSS
jgi:hypothetical protein